MHWGVALLLSLLLLQGCSSLHSNHEFSFYNQMIEEEVRIWPAAPQQGRIQYLGELVGEQNIVSSTPSTLIRTSQRFLKKLVGLGHRTQQQNILQRPQSGAVDAEGNIYVTDVSRQAVYRFSPAQKTLQIWEYAKQGVRFVAPIGIAVGESRTLWVADSALGVVVQLDALGEPLTSIGEDVLVRPTGLALDKVNRQLFVADTAENRIKVFDYEGNLIRTIGEPGEEKGQLNGPTYLAYHAGKLYVSDTLNARVQIFSPDGEWLSGFGQRGLYLGDMTRPKGIAVDRHENVYVVESYYDYLLIFDNQGDFLLPVGGSGKEVGQFYLPAGVWTDENDRIFVADMFNGRIVVFQRLD